MWQGDFLYVLTQVLFVLMQGKLQQLLFHVAGPGLVTDFIGEVVKGKALLAGDGAPLSVVGPWCKHEKQTFGTGIKVLPGWLVKRREAVLQDNDEWMLSIQSSAGDLFLTGRDTWAHHHTTLVSSM